MKYQVKRFIRKCDKTGCNKEIYDFEEYKNVCFICHKDFCNEHIILCCRFDEPTEKFVGKIQLRPRLENETDKDYFERVTGTNWVRFEKYPPEDIWNAIHDNDLTYYEAKRGQKGYLTLDNKNIYEILEIEQRDIEESYCILEQLDNNTIKFETQFYNGGADLEDMIGDEMRKNE